MSEQSLLTGGTVTSYKEGQKMFGQMAIELQRPTMLHHMWASSIPKEQLDRVIPERLKQMMLLKGRPVTQITNYEAMLYLSTLSMCAPLGHAAYNTYVYLFRTCLPKKAVTIFDEYELKRELDISEKMELDDLKRKLYNRSLKLLKDRNKK